MASHRLLTDTSFWLVVVLLFQNPPSLQTGTNLAVTFFWYSSYSRMMPIGGYKSRRLIRYGAIPTEKQLTVNSEPDFTVIHSVVG
jgi:hypothetical protein